MPHYVKVPIWFEGIKRFKGFPPFDEKIPGLPLLSYHHIIYFMYDCIGIKKNKSVASSKIWMNVCLQWWWAEHGGIKLVPFVIHNLWVDPAAASCLSRWCPKLIMVHEKRWIELRFFFLQCS